MTEQLLDTLSTTDENLEEIILKKNKRGSKLSLVVGDNLFQVVRINRFSNVLHEFSITKDSVLGFRHRSFQALRSWRIIILTVCVISLIFITPFSTTWSSPFYLADFIFLSTFALLIFLSGNPHILIFDTKSCSYSIFFFEWWSDRRRVSKTLSGIGLAMSSFLISREFKIPEVTYNIGRIGDTIGRLGDTVATDSVVIEENG
jgi:hypothetical protein